MPSPSFEDVQAMCHPVDWGEGGKKCHRDKRGQENDCDWVDVRKAPSCVLLSASQGRMQSFHTSARDRVEVVGGVMNEHEENSFRDIISVCRSFVGKCVSKQGSEKTWSSLKKFLENVCLYSSFMSVLGTFALIILSFGKEILPWYKSKVIKLAQYLHTDYCVMLKVTPGPGTNRLFHKMCWLCIHCSEL